MVKYKDLYGLQLNVIIPGIVAELERIAPWFEANGFDIIVRDTDHVYDSLRIYLESSTNKDYERLLFAEDKLKQSIRNTCCKCGCHDNISLYPYDDKSSWQYAHLLCTDCYNKVIEEKRSRREEW